MNWREGFRKGRSHLLMVAILAIAGSMVVRLEDDTLQREMGQAPGRPLNAAQGSAVRIVLGAFAGHTDAQRHMQRVRPLLPPGHARLLTIRPENGRFHVDLGPLSAQEARQVCNRLNGLRQSCMTVSARSAS